MTKPIPITQDSGYYQDLKFFLELNRQICIFLRGIYSDAFSEKKEVENVMALIRFRRIPSLRRQEQKTLYFVVFFSICVIKVVTSKRHNWLRNGRRIKFDKIKCVSGIPWVQCTNRFSSTVMQTRDISSWSKPLKNPLFTVLNYQPIKNKNRAGKMHLKVARAVPKGLHIVLRQS